MKFDKWDFPEDLYYDTHYQWIRREDNRIRFGLTPFGLDITGDVLYLSLPEAGAIVQAGSAFGSLESGKWVGRIYAPVSGLVTAVNKAVSASPDSISGSPYECWFAEIEPDQPIEAGRLMTASAVVDRLHQDNRAYA